MIVNVGHDYLLDGRTLVHVQDRDCLNLIAKVGIPDLNNMMFDTEWVSWDRLTKRSEV